MDNTNIRHTCWYHENPSKNRFGFEKDEDPIELKPFIIHEPSPGSFIQLIPNFYSEEEEYSLFRKLIR